MKRSRLTVLLFVLGCLAVLLLLTPLGRIANAIFIIGSIYNAPISFYGKVVDQFGNPVADAKVDYAAVDQLLANGSSYQGQADKNGYFSTAKIHGAGLIVGVTKDGYDPIDGKSSQAFGYGMGVDEYRQKPPTQDHPAIFVLRKKANAEPLDVISSRPYVVDRTGVPTAINLETAGASASGGPDTIEVSILMHEKPNIEKKYYDWDFGISVPGGGLIERTDGMEFAAPETGYTPQQQVQVKNPESFPRWTSNVDKQYFVKLGDGRYARVSLTAYVGKSTFVVLELYLNPKFGSRNLEFDPRVQAATH